MKEEEDENKKDSALLTWTAQDEEDLYKEQKEYRRRNHIPLER